MRALIRELFARATGFLGRFLAAVGILSALAVPSAASIGDCDDDGVVSIEELVTCLDITLGVFPVSACISADASGDEVVTVDELVLAVSNALEGRPPFATPTPTPPSSPSPSATATFGFDTVPTNPADLVPWLQAGNYLGWQAESAVHVSAGPHTATVRTYVNDLLYDSLASGLSAHPAGAAAVKELYGGGDRVLGWAVEVKVQDDSASGQGWYWYESPGLSGFGLGICTGCHVGGHDYVWTPFPLR